MKAFSMEKSVRSPTELADDDAVRISHRVTFSITAQLQKRDGNSLITNELVGKRVSEVTNWPATINLECRTAS